MQYVRIITIIMTVLMCLCVKTIREQDLFYPRRFPARPVSAPLSALELAAADSVTLRGWLVRADSARGDLIYFYGNGETVADSYSRLLWFSRTLHVNVAALDYRGYGYSDGTPSIDRILDDALLIYDSLASLTGRETGNVIVYGRSIGTIFAAGLAARRPTSCTILEAPITTAAEVIRSWGRQLPWPLRWVVGFRPERSLATARPQPIDYIAQIRSPLMIIHGTDDDVVPYRFGRKAFAASTSAGKEFCGVQGAGHNDLDITSRDVSGRLLAFVNSALHGD